MFYAAFNSISVISRPQFTLFTSSWKLVKKKMLTIFQNQVSTTDQLLQITHADMGTYSFADELTLSKISPGFTCLLYKSFENTVGKGEIARNEIAHNENTVEKGEIARNEHFLLFPQCFLPFWRTFCHLHQTEMCHLQTL